MKKLLIIYFIFLTAISSGQIMMPGVVASSTSSSGSTLLNGLLADLELDESGTTFTNSAGTGNATGSGTAQDGTYKISVYSQLLDNSSDYISYSPTNIYPTGIAYTFSCWVRFTSDPSGNNLLQINRSGGYAMTCYFISTSQLYFSGYNSSATEYTCSTTGITFSNNTWYHIVIVVRNGASIQIWVNGVDRSTSADTFSGTWATPTTAYFGSDGAGYAIPGYIDQVKIYKRVVAVDSLYNGGTGITYPFN